MNFVEKGKLLHEVIERLYNEEFLTIDGKVIFDLNTPISEEWREMTKDNKEKVNMINEIFN